MQRFIKLLYTVTVLIHSYKLYFFAKQKFLKLILSIYIYNRRCPEPMSDCFIIYVQPITDRHLKKFVENILMSSAKKGFI